MHESAMAKEEKSRLLEMRSGVEAACCAPEDVPVEVDPIDPVLLVDPIDPALLANRRPGGSQRNAGRWFLSVCAAGMAALAVWTFRGQVSRTMMRFSSQAPHDGGLQQKALVAPGEWHQRWVVGHLVYVMDPWLKKVKPSHMPNLGNGYMATQIGRDYMYLSGVFNGLKGSSHRAKVPATFNIWPKQTMAGMSLDFGHGVVHQVFYWPQATASQRVYVHRAYPHLAVVELTINNTGDQPLEVPMSDDFTAGELESPDLRIQISEQSENLTCLEAVTKESEIAPTTQVIGIGLCRSNAPEKIVVPAHSVELRTFVTVVWTTRDQRLYGDAVTPLQAARAEHEDFSEARPDMLYQKHLDAMAYVWRGGIEVEGNVELAKQVNSSWWNILLSLHKGENMSSSPGGLAHGCYKGHTFWDMEMFIWPNLLLFHRELAVASLQYRYDRRAPAAAISQSFAHSGLKFPWESGFSGDEVCAWGPGWSELHINGDVSFAFWQYWQATGDLGWMRSVGWPVLSGIAQFWTSRSHHPATPDAVGDFWGIQDVTDVDEDSQHVTNSGFTNAVAKLALRNAVKAARIVGQLGAIGGQWPTWGDFAEGIPIPFDGTRQRHAGFEQSTANCNGLGIAMMQYPLRIPKHWPGNWSDTVRRNDLHYADGWKEAGPPAGYSMYWWAFAIAWLELDEQRIAKALFDRMSEFVIGPFRNWHEKPNARGCPNFLTGAGGFLQLVWAGYGGVRLTDDALYLRNPRPLPKSDALRFRALEYQGSLVDVYINWTSVSLRLNQESPPGPLALHVSHDNSSTPVRLLRNASLVFPREGVVKVQPVRSRL